MPDSPRHSLSTVLKRALRMPFPLVSLTVGTLWALAIQGLGGLVIFGGAVTLAALYAIIKLQDEAFIRAALREAHEREEKSDLVDRTFRIEELDVDSRVKMKTICKMQSQIAEDVENSPVGESAAGLADTVETTEKLVERGLELAQKRRPLLRYLGRTEEAGISDRIRSLEAKLQAENDVSRRAELEVSLAAKRQELDDYHAIRRSAERILDQLDAIECSFEGLRARLVRIKSSDIAEWTAAKEELGTELAGLSNSVDILAESINEALTISGSTGGPDSPHPR